VYEDTDLALLKTHYYGGIRKYQWMSIPLALHGRIVRADGSAVDIIIGEDPGDPVFVVSDLLPHLAGKVQEDKKVSEAFEGEKLNLIAGSIPLGSDSVSDRFKLALLNHFHQKYEIVEADFVSAELEVVPAAMARDIGLDRSLVGAYGQDDRICAFTQLMALFEIESPQRTALGLFFDKEEIGSEGSTGAQTAFMEEFISDLIFLTAGKVDSHTLRRSIVNTRALSADVNAAMDPDFKEVHEKMNAAKIGHGVCMTKFTGARGKSGSSDASAEFVGEIRNLFDNNKVAWQTGELGKIDQGGGGTLAKFLAKKGMDILDCGPAVLSMHSPFEISSKADIYMTYKGYHAFYEIRF
jgi:aspartyl aminopeptidase